MRLCKRTGWIAFPRIYGIDAAAPSPALHLGMVLPSTYVPRLLRFTKTERESSGCWFGRKQDLKNMGFALVSYTVNQVSDSQG